MKSTLDSSAGKEYELSKAADGTIAVYFRQQTMDPVMITFFVLPVLFFTSCSGVFAVSNTFGVFNGMIPTLIVFALVLAAGYAGVWSFNNRKVCMTIVPGQGVECGDRKLAYADIERVGAQTSTMGKNGFRVYAQVGGEKVFITEYMPFARAEALQDVMQQYRDLNQREDHAPMK